MGAGKGKARRAQRRLLGGKKPVLKPVGEEEQSDGSISYCSVTDDGIKQWNDAQGLLHRIDGPAAEYADGTKEWRLKGQLHRVDGPAQEHADGTKVWYSNGEQHRVGGPAAEHANGDKAWVEHGQYHRLGGPAVEHANGATEWYEHDQLHRVDGPAVEYADGSKAWWLYGKEVGEEGVRKAAALESLGEVEFEPLEKVTF